MDLGRKLALIDPAEMYDHELWPGVTNLLLQQMAKRAWSMFKLYLSNVALELGTRSNLSSMEVDLPALVDDEVRCCLK